MTQLMRKKPEPRPWEHIACLYRYGTYVSYSYVSRTTHNSSQKHKYINFLHHAPPGTCEQPLLPPKRFPVSKDPFVEQIVEH